MKATFITLAVAGLAAAQNLDGIAPCVKSCIEKAIAGAGCTGTEAQIAVCACKPDTQAKLLAPVTQCATQNKCDTADLIKAQGIAAEQCKNLPTGSGTATGSSTGTASKASTASGSSTGSVTTTVVIPSLTSTGTGGVPTNSMNQTTSSGATGTTKAPTTTGGSGGTQTSGSGTVPTSTGAAAGGPVVGALAAVLAAAFAL